MKQELPPHSAVWQRDVSIRCGMSVEVSSTERWRLLRFILKVTCCDPGGTTDYSDPISSTFPSTLQNNRDVTLVWQYRPHLPSVFHYCLSSSYSGPPLWPSGQSSWLHNGDVLCFLWGKNWIYRCYVEESRPPLWSSGQSSWLQFRDVLCFLWGTNWIYIRIVCYIEERLSLWSSCQSSWLQNGDVLWFLWGTNWIHICYVEESRPPLWSSGQSSWLHNGSHSVGIICWLTKASELFFLSNYSTLYALWINVCIAKYTKKLFAKAMRFTT
jgi:hypothetical protein